MLRRKERKKRKQEQICKIGVDKEDLCTLKINCKGKRTVGKANKGINVVKIIIGLNKEKKKRGKKQNKKRKASQNCKSWKQRQKFITTINSVIKK